MDVLVLLGSFALLCAIGVPVAYSLGLSAIAGALYVDIPLEAVMLKISDGVNKFSLLAIPFFGLALFLERADAGREVIRSALWVVLVFLAAFVVVTRTAAPYPYTSWIPAAVADPARGVGLLFDATVAGVRAYPPGSVATSPSAVAMAPS